MNSKAACRGFLSILAVSTVLMGCEWYGTTLSGTVTITAAVAPDEQGVVLLLINDDFRYPFPSQENQEWTVDSWSPEQHQAHVVFPSGRMDSATGWYDRVIYVPSKREYFYWHSELQYDATEVFLGAFVDLNDNNQLDAGEPWGPCNNNPLRDLVDDTSPQAPNQADITIGIIHLADERSEFGDADEAD